MVRTALVTGGTGAIGSEIVRRLRDDGVVTHAWSHLVDVRNETAVMNAVEKIGDIDILINNAGIFGPTGSVLGYLRSDWDEVMEVNLTGQFLVAKWVIPGMVRRGYGRVVMMSSASGKDPSPIAPAYSVSKAGVIALTKALGKELAKTGVTVNCITPSSADTKFFKNLTREQMDAMSKRGPMGRFLTVDEIATMVCWMASEECSASTGACFDISAGRCQF